VHVRMESFHNDFFRCDIEEFVDWSFDKVRDGFIVDECLLLESHVVFHPLSGRVCTSVNNK